MHDDHDEPHPSMKPAEEAVRRERDLPCSADDAWSLLRDAEGLERWLADEVDLVVAPGEEGTLRDGDETRVVLVESVDEGRRLSLRWWSGEGEPSVVDLTLEPVGDDASRLVVTELPLRIIGAPQAVPASWSITDGGSATNGLQALALAR
ncbi:MAG: SRPBCC domain-containing protein [Solirubrobacteraceae bacterium]|nr:SRPBCC domain-containing protein [Solirubrobacteraceae bacterium]